MKNLMIISLLLTSLFSLSSQAKTQKQVLECAIGYSYLVNADLSENVITIWLIAGGAVSEVRKDVIVKKEEGFGAFTLRLKKYGSLSVSATDYNNWLIGDWDHKGLLDADLADEADSNINGKASLTECSFQ